jgi:hypothetical protein
MTFFDRLRYRSPCNCPSSRIPLMPPGSSPLPLLWGTPLVLCSGARYVSGPLVLFFLRTGIVRPLAPPPPNFSPGVSACSRLPFHFFLPSVPSLLQVRCLVPIRSLQGCRFVLFEFGRCFLRSVCVRGDKRHFCVRAVSGVWHLWCVSSLLQVTLEGGRYLPVRVRHVLLLADAFVEVVSLVRSFVSLSPANWPFLFVFGVSSAGAEL